MAASTNSGVSHTLSTTNGFSLGIPDSARTYFFSEEIAFQIFEFLPPKDRETVARVCKAFYFFANKFQLQENHCSYALYMREFSSDTTAIGMVDSAIRFKNTCFKLYVLACRFYISTDLIKDLREFPTLEEGNKYQKKAQATLSKMKKGELPVEKKAACDAVLKNSDKLSIEKTIEDDALFAFRISIINQILKVFSLGCEMKGSRIIVTTSLEENTQMNQVLQSDILNWAFKFGYPRNVIELLLSKNFKPTSQNLFIALSSKQPKDVIELLLQSGASAANPRYDLISCTEYSIEIAELLLQHGAQVTSATISNFVYRGVVSDEYMILLTTKNQLHVSELNSVLTQAIIFNRSEKIIECLIEKGAKASPDCIKYALEHPYPQRIIDLLNENKEKTSSRPYPLETSSSSQRLFLQSTAKIKNMADSYISKVSTLFQRKNVDDLVLFSQVVCLIAETSFL